MSSPVIRGLSITVLNWFENKAAAFWAGTLCRARTWLVAKCRSSDAAPLAIALRFPRTRRWGDLDRHYRELFAL